jgi:hypothetical protein
MGKRHNSRRGDVVMSEQRNSDRYGFFHSGYRWTYEKADLEQGAYSLSDSNLKRVAVIFPHDSTRPIDHPGENAALYTREYNSDDWPYIGRYSLGEALTRGGLHADRYREQERRAALQFFRGATSKPNETMKTLRNGAERAADIIATCEIPRGEDLNETIANYAEGMSRANGKSQKYNEKQIRKYLKARSWERDEDREP